MDRTTGSCSPRSSESNSASSDAALISLNDLEVYETRNASLTGYPFGGAATPVYDFAGNILIRDVNGGIGPGRPAL